MKLFEITKSRNKMTIGAAMLAIIHASTGRWIGRQIGGLVEAAAV